MCFKLLCLKLIVLTEWGRSNTSINLFFSQVKSINVFGNFGNKIKLLNEHSIIIKFVFSKFGRWFKFKLIKVKYLIEFGNSGNVSCIEKTLENGSGWKSENIIDVVNTISIDSIIENYGTINLLKIDVEGAEYEFLLNKDLSKINYITGEFHFEQEKKDELNDWISKTHKRFKVSGYPDYFKLKTL